MLLNWVPVSGGAVADALGVVALFAVAEADVDVVVRPPLLLETKIFGCLWEVWLELQNIYRVTIQVDSNLPLTSKQKYRFSMRSTY